MADNTRIEWTDATWNPITGCSIISPGCTNCYAMKLAGTRLKHHESRAGLTKESKAGPVWTGEVRFNEQWLEQPLRWTKPRMIFVCAHGDLFAEGVPDEWIDQVFAVMALAPQHTFQVLTKRPERMRDYLRQVMDDPQRFTKWAARGFHLATLANRDSEIPPRFPLPNVWLGVSVEDQNRADERIPILLDTPAAIRWISAEPLLGPQDLSRWLATANVTCKACNRSFWLHEANPCDHADGGGWTLACPHCGGCRCKPAWTEADARTIDMQPPSDWVDKNIGRFSKVHPTIEVKSGIDWVVAGGEGGPGARPMHPDWARSLRDQCKAAAVPFLFKQWGEYAPCPWKLVQEPGEDNDAYKARSEEECSRLAVSRTGYIHEMSHAPWSCERVLPAPDSHHAIKKVGKARAGRLLDGIEHNAFPVTGR